MSKLSKLMKSPSLFFRDFFDKRITKAVKSTKKAPPQKLPSTTIELLHYNPYYEYQFYFYSGETLAAGAHHINTWLPLFLQSRVPFLMIINDYKLYRWIISNYPSVHIVFAKNAVAIEEVLHRTKGVNLALYASAHATNRHLIRIGENIRHCFIGHGDSEKASSAHKALRIFDEIWTAGQAHIDRFKNKPFSTEGLTFKKVGRPLLNPLLCHSETPWYARGEMRLLYLPTWENALEVHNYSSLYQAKSMFQMINEKFDIQTDIKIHSFTGARDKTLANVESLLENSFMESQKIRVLPKSLNILDILNSYNLFLCDISSVVTECLALNSPIFLYFPKFKELDIAKSNMSFDDYCYVFSSVEELEADLREVISGNDYKAEKRKLAMDYFIGLEETKNMRFFDALLED